jgi:hypothetical protein
MFIYNITIKVNNSILEEWIKWQDEEHIPEIMATNLFDDYRFFRLLGQEDPEGSTFVIQYATSSRKNYDEYIQQYAVDLREKALKKWGDQFIAFRSLLESVH